jgi:enoyl-CoA hydratase
MYGEFESLAIELRDGGALWVHMTDGPTLDADLAQLYGRVSNAPEVRVVVLTGAKEKAFCVGGGGATVPTEAQARNAYWVNGMREAREVIFSALDCNKPVIGRINGHAVGKGCSIALCCDITVMVEDSKIGDTHVKVGLTCGDGGSLLWPYLVGMVTARRFLLTGDLLTGREAASIGLVTEATPRAELDDRIAVWIEKLTRSAAPTAVALTKRALNSAIRQQATAHMDMSLGMETLSFLTEDHREGAAALVEKRTPKFTGR